MPMQNTLVALNIMLIFIILGVLIMAIQPLQASSYAFIPPYEEFQDDDAMLTTKEKELFEDLKENKLSQDDIKRLIIDGTLTDNIINKFLKRIDFPPLVKKDKKEEIKEDFKDFVAPYACEDLYVGELQSWTPEPRYWDGTRPQHENDEKVRGKC